VKIVDNAPNRANAKRGESFKRLGLPLRYSGLPKAIDWNERPDIPANIEKMKPISKSRRIQLLIPP
jgi:hypothetical protein